MAEAHIIDGKAHELASEAFSIITRQKFDYFESKEDAYANLRRRALYGENVDYLNSLDIEKTELGVKVPRDYDLLNANLVVAFEALSQPDTQPFLHVDRYGMTAGLVDSDAATLSLAVTPHTPACSIRIAANDIVRYGFIPQQRDNGFTSVSDGILRLSLGRHLLSEHSSSDEQFFAVSELIDRDWERALIVGSAAVESFISSGLQMSLDGAYSGDAQDKSFRSGLVAVSAGFIYSGEGFLKIDT